MTWMRRFEIDYDSIEGNWLIYMGAGIWGASLLYILFFMSRWPYPAYSYIAAVASFIIGLSFILFAKMHGSSEIHVRVTALVAGVMMYFLWYVLFVRSTIYGTDSLAVHVGLIVLFVLSIVFLIYSFAVNDRSLFKIRR